MNLILDILFPKKCVGCKKSGSYFCASCISQIKQVELICPRCERPALGGQTHPVCQRKFGLDGLWSLGVYQGSLQSAIKQLKYHWVKELAEKLTDITIEYWAFYQPFLLEQIKKSYGREWGIIPVPLHWYRQNWRGFNQSAILGLNLSKKLGLDYCEGLKRTHYTKSQVKLKSHDRRKNVFNAFSLNTKYQILNTNVLLVDDVWTTGSTLKECCYVLKRAGAKKVWAITLAR